VPAEVRRRVEVVAIDGSFGILSGEEMFSRGRDERMDYLDRLAGA